MRLDFYHGPLNFFKQTLGALRSELLLAVSLGLWALLRLLQVIQAVKKEGGIIVKLLGKEVLSIGDGDEDDERPARRARAKIEAQKG